MFALKNLVMHRPVCYRNAVLGVETSCLLSKSLVLSRPVCYRNAEFGMNDPFVKFAFSLPSLLMKRLLTDSRTASGFSCMQIILIQIVFSHCTSFMT